MSARASASWRGWSLIACCTWMNWRSTQSRFRKTCWPGSLLPVQLVALPLQGGEKTWVTHRYQTAPLELSLGTSKIRFQRFTLPENTRAFAELCQQGRSPERNCQFSLPQNWELQPWAQWGIEHTARWVSDICVSIVWSFVTCNHTCFCFCFFPPNQPSELQGDTSGFSSYPEEQNSPSHCIKNGPAARKGGGRGPRSKNWKPERKRESSAEVSRLQSKNCKTS